MRRLKVTSRGRVTLPKEGLQQLGIQPGEVLEIERLPSGRITLPVARPKGEIDDLIGMLAGKTQKVATLDAIHKASSAGWAGES